MITVKELRVLLEQFPDDSVVILSKDAEGNYFSPLEILGPGMYEAEDEYSGEFFDARIIGNDEYSQPNEEAIQAICLDPVN